VAWNVERYSRVCVCFFDLSKVEDLTSEAVGFDATVVCSRVEVR